MAIEARGDIKYDDKGNMTKEEIDKTIEILIEAKKSGQFRAFWTTFDESVNLMASGEVVIQSMWSPAVTAVRSRGIPCFYAPLKEGYRAWASYIAPMRHLNGIKLDAAYEYLNWYMSGWQGGFIAKQGYYSSVPETAKKFMTEDEWDYWYEGKPAKGEIKDPYGNLMEKAGHGARRRRLLGAHGQRRLLEHADGREPATWSRSGTSSSRPDASPSPAAPHPARSSRSPRAGSLPKGERELRGSCRASRPTCRSRRSPWCCWCSSAFRCWWSSPSASSTSTTSTSCPAFVFGNYADLLARGRRSCSTCKTIYYALIVWAITLVIGFTVAYFLVFHVRSILWQMALFLLCTVPFWTSNIIRMISWIPFLGRNGIFNQALIGLGVTDKPLEFLLFSDFAVIDRLRASVHAVHDRADLQLHGPHRSLADRGGGGRRRSGWRVIWDIVIPLSQDRHRARLDLRASRW